MTKERLKELIEQEGTVYEIHKLCRYIVKLKLRSSNYVSEDGLYLYDRCEAGVVFYLDNLYETKEQAEWALKTVTERTERFEPPMWDDIEKRKNDYLFRFTVNNEIITFNVMIDEDIDLTDIMIYNTSIGKNIFWKALTKENYEKACEIVRDLFKEWK